MKRLFLHIILACAYQFIYASYDITGVPTNIQENINNRLSLKVPSQPSATNQYLDQVRFETAEAIKPYGYFSPLVFVSYQNDKTIIDISLGQLDAIHHISYDLSETQDKAVAQSVDHIIHSYVLTPFSTDNIQHLQQDMLSALRSLGYANSRIERERTLVDLTQESNNSIHFNIILNDKVYFGDVFTTDPSEKKCIDKYLAFAPGDVFSQEAVQQTQRNFIESGNFKESRISSKPNTINPNIINTIIETKALDPVVYAVGLGIISSSDENYAFEPNVIFNLTINNVIDCGSKLINRISFAKQDSQISSDLLIPSPYSLNDYYLISSSARQFLQQSEDAGEYFMLTLLANKTYHNFTFQPSLNYLIETSSINNPDIDDNPNSYLTKILYPKLKAKWLQKRSNGYTLLKSKISASAKEFQSDLSFIRINGTAKNTFDLPSALLINQASFGHISTDNFEQFPLSMQYTLGGPESLRGIEYQQINQGKRFLLSRNSIQLRHDNILVGGFFDSGFCTSTDEEKLIKTAGALMSYETPYSIFNLSIGKPISEGEWVILFSIDPGVF